ncbi:conserved hypothetical protein [Verrucomicrobia bacterium]|nr:conserved hypothetical protein [Verrucomicrobiota bacterium]
MGQVRFLNLDLGFSICGRLATRVGPRELVAATNQSLELGQEIRAPHSGQAAALLLLLFAAFPSTLAAQAARASTPDPLMSLMLSQPKIDLATQVVAVASFDPPVVRPGQQSIYRVTFNALEESIAWPDDIGAPPKLEVRPGARGQIFQMAGPKMEPHTTFNFHVRASAVGEYTIPLFMVTVDEQEVGVPPAQLNVVDSPPPSIEPPLILEVAATNLFIGQPVSARVLLPAGLSGPQGMSQVQFNGEDFLVDQSAPHQRIDRANLGGTNVAAYIYETILTPISAGKLTISAQGFTAGMRFSGPISLRGPISIPPGPPQYTLLESDPAQIEVRPLPTEGQLPGFTGAIGNFLVDPPRLDPGVLRVGEAAKLTVTLRGAGNIEHLVAPPPPQAQDWQVFAPTDRSLGPAPAAFTPALLAGAGPSAAVTFSYALIPLSQKVKATPPIPFCAFNPATGTYTDLTIPPVPVRVQPGNASPEAAALLQAGAGPTEPEKEAVLSGLAASPGWRAGSLTPLQQRAWFALVQLAPALVILGLWAWDRRRRYLEQHPDILLRRRARRALHREWRALKKAAQTGDAPAYVAAAVRALRVACAPHYPAEPGALVGGDVLHLLPDRVDGSDNSHAASGEVVRRVFAVSDASRFALAATDARELLPLQPDLERVLEQLEEKL